MIIWGCCTLQNAFWQHAITLHSLSPSLSFLLSLSDTYTHTHAYTHTLTQTYRHSRTHTYTHTLTHARTRARTHTLIHTPDILSTICMRNTKRSGFVSMAMTWQVRQIYVCMCVYVYTYICVCVCVYINKKRHVRVPNNYTQKSV